MSLTLEREYMMTMLPYDDYYQTILLNLGKFLAILKIDHSPISLVDSLKSLSTKPNSEIWKLFIISKNREQCFSNVLAMF